MDDQSNENTPLSSDDSGATRITVSTNSSQAGPDASPQTEPTQLPSTSANEPLAPASTPEPMASASAPTSTPAPGAVISSDDPTGSAPPPQMPTPGQAVVSSSGGGRRSLKVLVGLLIVVVLCVAGWFVYDNFIKTKPAPAVTKSKDIPVLNIGVLQADYGDLYPNMSFNEYSYIVNAQMFDGLVQYENKNKLAPDLATTWTNPDSTTWIFTLKKNVKFHDGNIMTADDVKYSLDTVMASTTDFAKTFTSTLESVSVVNTSQVKITTKSADPTLLNKLAFLYIIDAKLPQGQNASMAGTGPYEVKSGTKPSNTSYQLVAAKNYSGTKPTVHALNFGSEPDQTKLVNAFKSHQYNIAGPIDPTEAKKVSGAVKFVSSEPDVDFIGFNTTNPGPLQNKLVREAIRYAINPAAIDQVRSTQGTPISQLIPESIPGYNPSITPYKQDVQKAKQLLAEAGYANGLTIRYSYSSDSPETTNELTKELKAVGITLTPDPHDSFDEFINYFTNGQADMYSVDYSSDTLDGLDIYQTTLSQKNYNNPKLTALLDQAGTTTDPAKRLKLLQDAAKIIDQDIAVVPISTGEDIWLMDKDYAIQQDMPSSLISVYFSKVHLK